MSKVIIYNGQLFMGGIENVLINYLKKMSTENVSPFLVIRENNPEKNVFEKNIPENIEYEFLRSEKYVKFREKISREKRKNLFLKAFYNILISYERYYTWKNMKEYLKKHSDSEVIVDFDMSLGKTIHKIKDKKKVGWIHCTVEGKNPRKMKRYGKRLKKYDKIVAVCDDLVEEVGSIFPNIKDKLVRIYNPFNFEEIRKKSNDKCELSSEEEKLIQDDYIVGVSRLVPGKDRITLIKAFKLLKDKGIKEKLYLLGEGSHRQEIEKTIKELSLEGEVFLLGQKKNPFVWIKNARLFAHSSFGEGLPSVFIESMVVGTPVVSANCPTGPREILMDGECGGLSKVQDEKDLAEKIYAALYDERTRKSYIENTAKRVSEFSDDFILEQFQKLIGEL